MLSRRVSRVTGVGELPPTSDLVGFQFAGIAGGADAFAIGPSLAGVIDVLEVFWSVGETGSPTSAHQLQLAVGSVVPGSLAEMRALAQVLPNASAASSTVKGTWTVPGASRAGAFRGRFRVVIKGERLVCRFSNASASGVSCYVGVVYERLEVEAGNGDLEVRARDAR